MRYINLLLLSVLFSDYKSWKCIWALKKWINWGGAGLCSIAPLGDILREGMACFLPSCSSELIPQKSSSVDRLRLHYYHRFTAQACIFRNGCLHKLHTSSAAFVCFTAQFILMYIILYAWIFMSVAMIQTSHTASLFSAGFSPSHINTRLLKISQSGQQRLELTLEELINATLVTFCCKIKISVCEHCCDF